jgi:hypothetical protein
MRKNKLIMAKERMHCKRNAAAQPQAVVQKNQLI